MKIQILLLAIALLYPCSGMSILSAKSKIKQPGISRDTADHMYKLFNDSVVFYSSGNEPFWNLKIMRDLTLVFETLNGVSIKTGTAVVSKAMDANVKRYDGSSHAGSLSVSVYEEDCDDTMSEESFRYRVNVNYFPPGSMNSEEYSGCGRYIPDYKLSGSWKLKMIGSENIADSAYRNNVPFIHFNMSALRVSGIAGCNRINGTVWQEGNHMRFENIAMTMMGCPEEMRENEIVNGLNSAMTYAIIGDELSLSNPDGVQLVYKKMNGEQGNAEETPERYVLLNDIWTLESLDGRPVKPEEFMKGVPFLELNIKDMKYMGKTGCNNLFGTFEATNETIKFGPAAMTKMMCPGNFEQGFIKALNSSNKWKIENMRLYLYRDDTELMVMKKTD